MTATFVLVSTSGQNFVVRLGDAAGAKKFSIQDSGSVEVAAVDSDGNFTLSGTFQPSTLVLPAAASPSQTAEGSVVWDSDDDVLTVGTGAARKTFGYLGSTTPSNGGTAAAGSSNETSRADHVHGGGVANKYKTTAQAFTTTTTLADITATSGNFAFSIGVNESWAVNYYITAITSSTGGLKLGLTGPSSPTRVTGIITQTVAYTDSATANGTPISLTQLYSVLDTTSFGTIMTVPSDNSSSPYSGGQMVGDGSTQSYFEVKCLITNGANAGTVTLQGAQNSSAGTTTLVSGCFMTATRVS